MTMKLFINARIYQPNCPIQHWMAVSKSSGSIIQIGTNPVPKDVLKEAKETVDLESKVVIPGLMDSHIHAYYQGETAHYVDLTGCSSFKELQDRLQNHIKKKKEENGHHPKQIIGFGWEQDKMSTQGAYPDRWMLDEVISDVPVILHRVCWHIAVVNSKALEVSGIDETSARKMEGGNIDFGTDGKPTGILREAAVNLLARNENEPQDVRLGYLRESLYRCVSSGLTTIQTNDEHAWKLYQQLQKADQLPLRVFLTVPYDELDHPETPAANTVDNLISCDRIKIFSDGSLGAETAALGEPYKDSDNKGILMYSDEEMFSRVQKVKTLGYRLEIHAIGDRAAAQVLNALDKAEIPASDRPILTHCQILGDDQLQQMHARSVIANIQPSFVVTDTSFARKRLNPKLLKSSYRWKTMKDQFGIVCAGGSDAPVETCNPFQGIYDAIYRTAPFDNETEVLHPEEKLTLDEALEIYTQSGAYAVKREDSLGRLHEGFLADFIVLQRDILDTHVRMLDHDIVKQVYVGGKCTFDRTLSSTQEEMAKMSGLPGKNGKFPICPCCKK